MALKRRDDGSDVVVLLVADTRHNRRVLRLAAPDLAGEYPVTGAAAVASIGNRRPPTASAIVLL